MFNAGNIAANISLDFAQFSRGINSVTSQVSSLGSQFNRTFGGNTPRQIERTAQATNQLNRELRNVDHIVSGILISQAFYQGVQGITAATEALHSFMGEMDKAQIALEYFLDTPQQATGFLTSMQDFAAETAFDTQQALTLARRLMGAEFEPIEVRGVMEILNDSTAAMGLEPDRIENITRALTQVKTNGRIAREELRQFAEAGLPIYTIMREELNLSREELANIGDLQIDGDLGVAAILRGLEKRYEGAAERIADTVPGMMETIRDNSLILGEAIFEGPYNAWSRFITRVRDGLEEARTALTNSGLGGAFEAIVPESLHEPIRMIVAGFQSLGQSLRMVVSALSPVFTLLNHVAITAFSIVVPAVAAVARVIAVTVQASMELYPWLRYLFAALVGLLIANTVGRALGFLWRVMRIGLIATAVANAVTALSRAIQFLYFVVSRHPIGALMTVLAGAAAYAVMQTDTVKKAMNGIAESMGGLFDIDTSKILQPVQNNAGEWSKEFQGNLDGLYEELDNLQGSGASAGDALKDVGDGAKDAGKKAKEAADDIEKTFIASFDEVFQVPDQLDKVADGIDKIGKEAGKGGGGLDETFDPNPGMGDPFGGGGMPDLGDPFGGGGGGFSFPEIDLPDFGLPALFKGFDFKLPPINPTAFVESLQGVLQVAGAWALRALEALHPKNWFQPVVNLFGVYVDQMVTKWQEFWGNIGGILQVGFGTLLSVFGINLPELKLQWDAWVDGLRVKLEGAVPLIVASVGLLFGGLLSAFGINLPSLQTQWAQFWDNLNGKVKGTSPVIVTGFVAMLTAMVAALVKNRPTLTTSWKQLWDNLNNKRVVTVPLIVAGFTGMLTSMLASLRNYRPNIQLNWGQMWDNLRSKQTVTIPTLVTGVATFLAGIANRFRQTLPTINVNWGQMWNNLRSTAGTMATNVGRVFNNFTDSITLESVLTVAGIALSFTGLPGKIAKGVGTLVPRVLPFFSGLKKNVGTIVDDIIGFFRDLPGKIGAFFGNIGKGIGDFAGNINISVPGFANGGIIGRHSLIQVGEGNKSEAIVPLENMNAMKPFSDAVAAGVRSNLGGYNPQPAAPMPGGFDNRQIVYVGTMIGDERSLKELERKLNIIRVSENTRGSDQ